MNYINDSAKKFLILTLVLGLTFISGLAQRNTNASKRQIEQLLTRLDNDATAFRNIVNSTRNRARWNTRQRELSNINEYIPDFDQATARLRQRFNNRQAIASDVEEVLNRGREIDSYFNNISVDTTIKQNWRNVRADLQTLARYYNIIWNWDNSSGSSAQGEVNNSVNSLTGTYSYEPVRSDDPNAAVDRAVQNMNRSDADRLRAVLLRRVEAPAQLSIEQNRNAFTIASSNAPAVTLQANGRSESETRANGRVVRTTITLRNNNLTISSLGERGSDFQVTFEPFENGRSLRVTRSFYTEQAARSVMTTSIYSRTSNYAQTNIYDGRNNSSANTNNERWENNRRQRSFIIPDGTRLSALLNHDIDTKQAQNGDRVTLTIRSPYMYDGAVIEGVLVDADRSGRVTGRAALSIDFQTMRFTDGRTTDFAAYIEEVRTADGQKVEVDNEGSVKDNKSQTERTVVRSGIGAAIGAIIGGIAGGGKGAAIGAAVGAGAGAGSIILQGRDDLKLLQGSEFTLRTSAPRNVAVK